jgi:hypothetical protein
MQTKIYYQQEIVAMKGKREQQAIQTLSCSVIRNTRLYNLPDLLHRQNNKNIYGTFFLMNLNNSLFPCPHLNIYFTDITLLYQYKL